MPVKYSGFDVLMEFDSFGEFVNYCEKTPDTGGELSSAITDEYDWYQSKSFGDAVSMARRGWIDKVPDVLAISNPLFENISQLVDATKISHDISGDALDMGRYISGEPEHWMNFDTEIIESPGRRKIARIVCNVSASCSLEADAITQKGAVMTALCQLLEYAGIRVEIIAATASWDDGVSGTVQVFTKIKCADEPLDIPRVIFALGHPSMLRRLVFRAWETMPMKIRRAYRMHEAGKGYGHIGDVQGERRGDVYIGKSDAKFSAMSQSEIREWVIDQAKKCGVEFAAN